MIRRGFTIVELIIVITILGILLTLAVVSLNGTQEKARDDERKADIESFALHLESYYANGRGDGVSNGRYPSDGILDTDGVAHLKRDFPDLDLKSVVAPGVDLNGNGSIDDEDVLATLQLATNSSQSPTGVMPQPTFGQYVYQPLQADGTLCTEASQDCRKFNLYYRLEADNTVYKYESKNR